MKLYSNAPLALSKRLWKPPGRSSENFKPIDTAQTFSRMSSNTARIWLSEASGSDGHCIVLENGMTISAVVRGKKTCKALADVLPGAKNGLPLVLGNTEEIVVTGMAPDTKIRTHASDSNTRLTLIAGLQGFAISTIKIYYKGAVMEVMGKAWNQKGVATIIDDSFDHEFQTEPGIVTASSGGTEVDEYSYVLEVSVMHPDLVNYPGRFAEAINKKTDFASAWKGERHREFLDAKNRTGPHPHLDPEDPSRFKAGMREAHEKARAIKLAKTKPFKPDPPKKALKIVGSTVEMSPAR